MRARNPHGSCTTSPAPSRSQQHAEPFVRGRHQLGVPPGPEQHRGPRPRVHRAHQVRGQPPRRGPLGLRVPGVADPGQHLGAAAAARSDPLRRNVISAARTPGAPTKPARVGQGVHRSERARVQQRQHQRPGLPVGDRTLGHEQRRPSAVGRAAASRSPGTAGARSGRRSRSAGAGRPRARRCTRARTTARAARRGRHRRARPGHLQPLPRRVRQHDVEPAAPAGHRVARARAAPSTVGERRPPGHRRGVHQRVADHHPLRRRLRRRSGRSAAPAPRTARATSGGPGQRDRGRVDVHPVQAAHRRAGRSPGREQPVQGDQQQRARTAGRVQHRRAARAAPGRQRAVGQRLRRGAAASRRRPAGAVRAGRPAASAPPSPSRTGRQLEQLVVAAGERPARPAASPAGRRGPARPARWLAARRRRPALLGSTRAAAACNRRQQRVVHRRSSGGGRDRAAGRSRTWPGRRGRASAGRRGGTQRASDVLPPTSSDPRLQHPLDLPGVDDLDAVEVLQPAARRAPGEPVRPDVQQPDVAQPVPGLLVDLADDRVQRRLAVVDAAAGQDPAPRRRRVARTAGSAGAGRRPARSRRRRPAASRHRASLRRRRCDLRHHHRSLRRP